MPGKLLAEWMAFERLEPFGRSWHAAAEIARAASVAGGVKKRDGTPLRPEDFLPWPPPRFEDDDED